MNTNVTTSSSVCAQPYTQTHTHTYTYEMRASLEPPQFEHRSRTRASVRFFATSVCRACFKTACLLP